MLILLLLLPHLLHLLQMLLFSMDPLNFVHVGFFLTLPKILNIFFHLKYEFFTLRICFLRLRLHLLLNIFNGLNLYWTLFFLFELVRFKVIIVDSFDIEVGLTYVTSNRFYGHNAYLNLGMHLWLSSSVNLMDSLQTSQVIGDIKSSSASSPSYYCFSFS